MRAFSTLIAATAVAASLASPAGAATEEHPGVAQLEGDWAGQVDTGAVSLRLVLHVHTRDGAAVTTLDSPDQGAQDVPVTVTVEGTQVRIAPPSGGVLVGELSADGARLDGAWGRANAHLARLAPGTVAPSPHRPQTPVKPYPYREEEVSYASKTAGVRLAATLTVPQGKGPFPAVLLIAGSGPNTRDEKIFDHALFQVLADQLTRAGVAVLRYDKRGTGQSSGKYAKATGEDFAADAEGGVAYLAARREISASRIGLLGHSEGGIIAPAVAQRDSRVRFVVLLAGAGVRGDEVIMSQMHAIAAASAIPDAALEHNEALERTVLDAVMAAKDQATAHDAALAILQERSGASREALDMQARAVATAWYRYFISYDPGPALRALHIPVLALIGSKDLQVVASVNIPALRAALAGNPDAEVMELEGLNHLFQTADTGAPKEYGKIEETISPRALTVITQWIETVKH